MEGERGSGWKRRLAEEVGRHRSVGLSCGCGPQRNWRDWDSSGSAAKIANLGWPGEASEASEAR